MRILDLGCGAGTGLVKLGVTESDEVTGVDIDDKVFGDREAPISEASVFRRCGREVALRQRELRLSDFRLTWISRKRFLRFTAFWFPEAKSGSAFIPPVLQ